MRIITSNRIPDGFFDAKPMEEVKIVKTVLEGVRKKGDKAVRAYALKFDRFSKKKMEVSQQDIRKAYGTVDKKTITVLKTAARNIARFAKAQLGQLKDMEIKSKEGIVGQKIIPLGKVGCYVPGGRYPLPSSALMSIIPAKVAGVEKIIVCSPRIAPVTIVAADIAGADRIFDLGGVQAIGAMAYGTKSILKMDKIVGPGNRYVAAAKREVYGTVGIDFIAGPSEVMIIADESGNPELIAADLLAQAEHDSDAQSVLITTSKPLAKKVKHQLNVQLSRLKTKEIAEAALGKGCIIVAKTLEEAAGIANRKAPEHLELHVRRPEALISQLKNYGSLFIGEETAEVFGDYCSGTNHILPTSGAARYTGGLSVRDFVKVVTYQKIRNRPSKAMIETASTLAAIEGLDAHRRAALLRRKETPLK